MTEQHSNPPTDANQDENRLIAERREKLDRIREREQGNAFPNTWRREHLAAKLDMQYADQDKPTLEASNEIGSVAGRIMAKRGPFIVIQDMSGRIQLYADKPVQQDIKDRWGQWDIGDIVGASGPIRRSGKGDLYVEMQEYQLLTKSLRPLPEKHAGLTDMEQRYRQRYVDLIVNEESRDTLRKRSQIIEFIRNYFSNLEFLEVETPMLQVIPGGATARPFVTHHNALDQDMYLRIAPELYLKRLVVGGVERVFEINRNFRNEGLSTRHNPEFTMLEFYQAYADYQDLMNLTEDLLRKLVDEVFGGSTILNHRRDADGEVQEVYEYDFSKAFERISVFDSILKYNPDIDPAKLGTEEGARAIAESLHIPLKASYGLGKVQIEIFEKTVEHLLIQPTFITEYPAEVSPLARRNDDNSFITDRFEFFVGGREIANGFSELNDSEDQAERFNAQVADKDAGDNEAMHFDTDYIRALEYGLPPTAGEGIGIDRLVMMLTDQASIRDVILFPAMRPE
jgi:lysyl-tRNA synthetase class 2